jgi:hypothetical protein
MIPVAVARTLTLPRVEPGAFVATKWYSPADKARFGDQLLRFFAQNCPHHLFTKSFYRTLSNHFGHIARYSEHGFWDYYFTDERAKAEFLDDTVRYVVCGDPAYTFSDLEIAVQQRIRRSGVLDWQRRAAQSEAEAIERALLKKLLEKYEPRATPREASLSADIPSILSVQSDLFS